MDVYLPDEFYALSETPNPRRSLAASDQRAWLGGEAFVAMPRESMQERESKPVAEPDPIWRVI
jgi:hypothetical protein